MATYSGASVMPTPLLSFQSPVLPVTSLCPSTSTTADKHPPWVKGHNHCPTHVEKQRKTEKVLWLELVPELLSPPFSLYISVIITPAKDTEPTLTPHQPATNKKPPAHVTFGY